LFTVGIRSQVDGKAEKAPLTEFQANKGDILVKIDRRLQEALDQTKAKRMPDEVRPSSAPKDLAGPRSLVDKSPQTQQRVDQQHARVDQLIVPINADATAIEVAQRHLYPNDVREAMAGGPAELTALSRDNTHVLSTGTLLLIGSFIDSNAIRLKPVFASKDEELWCGDFVNARVLVEIRRDVLVIPAPAIQRGPDGIFTWVAEPDNLVEAAWARSEQRPLSISSSHPGFPRESASWSTASTGSGGIRV
jgi:multidrug efflux system membrane fusion protein